MKSYPKKVLRTALDRTFDQYPKVAINHPALQSSMCQSLGVEPHEYRKFCDKLKSYLDLKVLQGYLLHGKGRMGGYRRVKDFTAEELAHQAKQQADWNKGCEIKHGIIAGLQAQIAEVTAKSPRDFIT